MSISPFNRALLRGLLAGSAVLTGTACSRSDRADSGRDNSAAVTQDTTSIVPDQTGSVAGRDSATQSLGNGGSATGTADTAPTAVRSNAPRAETAAAPTAPGDTSMTDSAAGYRAMDQDTAAVPAESDSARVTHDSSETSLAPSDTAAVETTTAPVGVGAAVVAGAAVAAGSASPAPGNSAVGSISTGHAAEGHAEMAPDTSTTADQTDTLNVADTAGTLEARVDTSQATEASDSGRAGAVLAAGAAGAAVGAAAGRDNDADANGGRVRPPEAASEDSTEIPAYETADEEILNPADQETVAASETRTDEVGAAAIASDITGAEAVALVSREGVRCTIVDPEENEAVRWDMSSTPVMLNPCGLGSMNLSKILTEGSAGQE
jgi:hypothetical protein